MTTAPDQQPVALLVGGAPGPVVDDAAAPFVRLDLGVLCGVRADGPELGVVELAPARPSAKRAAVRARAPGDRTRRVRRASAVVFCPIGATSATSRGGFAGASPRGGPTAASPDFRPTAATRRGRATRIACAPGRVLVRAARSAGSRAGILVIDWMRRLSAAEQRNIRRDDDDTDPLDRQGPHRSILTNCRSSAQPNFSSSGRGVGRTKMPG